MGVTDPRKLAVILRDLDEELQRWSIKASDALNTATYTQMITREATHQARRQTLITTEQYHEDEAVYRSRKRNVDELLVKYNDSVTAASKLVNTVEAKLQQAQKTLAHWTSELQKAIAWQKRAEERVRKAEIELANAERALASAERALASAQRALRDCQNTEHVERNSEGKVVRRWKPDCSGYQAAVRQAEAEVRRCEIRVNAARIELSNARAELQRAIARVKACGEAVDYSKQAVAKAEVSLQRAKSALSQAERALDHTRAAERALERTGELLEEERIKVEEMNVHITQCEDHLAEAQMHLFASTKLEESAQRYRIMARNELQHRVELLYALNRPELLGGISGDGWVVGATGFSAMITSIVSASGGAMGGPRAGKESLEQDPTKEGVWQVISTVIALNDLPEVTEQEAKPANQTLPIERMRSVLQNLKDMIPLIQDGIGHNATFWSTRDIETGTDPRSGYRVAYEEYYALTPIKSAQLDDDTYMIISGKERVWLARQVQMTHLPVQLFRRSEFLQPLRFTHTSGEEFEIRPYVEEQIVRLRLFNVSRRNKVPETITDGDATCLDITFMTDGSAEVTRFDRREHGFDAELLHLAEAVCQEKQVEALILRLASKVVDTPAKRDWFSTRGYRFNQEGAVMAFYKTLN